MESTSGQVDHAKSNRLKQILGRVGQVYISKISNTAQMDAQYSKTKFTFTTG